MFEHWLVAIDKDSISYDEDNSKSEDLGWNLVIKDNRLGTYNIDKLYSLVVL